MAAEPKCFEINVADRYILVITVPADVSHERCKQATEWATKKLNDWWESGEKFTALSVLPDVDIEVRRLEEEDGDKTPGIKRLAPGP